MKKWIHLLLWMIVPAVLVLIDQWTKSLAAANLRDQADVVLWDGVLRLRYLENEGMAFGLLEGGRVFFFIMTGLAIVLILFIFYRIVSGKRFLALRILLALILAGAIGNLIDRAALGYVVDFIYVELINFPVFNVADCYVTVGCVVLFFFILFYYKEDDFKKIFSFRKEKTDG